MKTETILTSNILSLIQTIDALANSSEKIIAIYGLPGLGKTKAGEYYRDYHNALHYRAFRKMTPYGLIQTILKPFMIKPRSMVAGLNILIDLLQDSKHQAMIIDECDALNDDCLEIIRTIHDMTGITTILIGEPQFYGQLKQHDRLFDRTTHIEFSPLSLADARRFVEDLSSIEISDQMIAAMHTYATGNLRRFKNIAGTHFFREILKAVLPIVSGEREIIS